MFGFIYLGLTTVCSFLQSLKDIKHDVNATVDPRTNTYIDSHGCHRDANTAAFRYWTIDNNGYEVLLDKQHNVIKNLTKEDWENKANELVESGSTLRAFDTFKSRNITYHGLCSKARIYIDIHTKEEYVAVKLLVPIKRQKEYKTFYARYSMPEKILFITDNQITEEKIKLSQHLYNWIEHPEDEKKFISEYNAKKIGYGNNERIPIISFIR